MLDKLPRVVVAVMCLLPGLALVSCSSSPSASSAKVAAKMTARSLYAAFTTHKSSADVRYKGKLLQVTGVVERVGTDPILNAPEIMLEGGATTGGKGVDCILDAQYARQVGKMRGGQTVSVQGTCDGYAVNVLLLHCRLSTTSS